MTALTSSAVRLPYAEHGDADGIPVILLHGYSDSHRSFEPLQAELPADIRAIAVTERGHGDAPTPHDGYDAPQMAADVVALLDHLGIERAVVVGHSMGSIVATRFALDAPERVAGLVLMGSRPSFGDLDELYEEVEAIGDGVDPEFIREFQLSTLNHPVPDAFLDMVCAESAKLPVHVWKAVAAAALRIDHAPELGQITAPTLIAWGEKDAFALREHQDALMRGIPGARFVVYEGAGHAFHWEDPAAFARDLVPFVREVAAA